MSFTPSKVVALIDCNNFYASCERLFRPELRKSPIVVLSNNDGCVIARSNEAKALDIPMGAPFFKYRDYFRVHRVHVFSSNFTLYGDLSHRVMETIRSFSCNVEVYSIDEAFVLFNRETALDDARKLKDKIFKWTGIPVSVGIAPTKTLAKAANKYAKSRIETAGVYSLAELPDRTPFLKAFKVEDLWGIGSRHATFLKKYNILNASDLMECEDQWLLKHLHLPGLKTVLELRGTPCIEFGEGPAPKKSMTCARGFGRVVTDLVELEKILASYVANLAEKLRKAKLETLHVSVFLSSNPFDTKQPYYSRNLALSLPEATSYTPGLIAAASSLLKRLFRKGLDYKKAGVMFCDLQSEGVKQLSLFHDPEKDKREVKSMKVLDEINKRWGKNTLTFASMGREKVSVYKTSRKSPSYTTQWGELLKIKI